MDTNKSLYQDYDTPNSVDKLNTADESHEKISAQNNLSNRPLNLSSTETITTPSFRKELTSLVEKLFAHPNMPRSKVLKLMQDVGKFSKNLLHTTLEKISNNFLEVDPNNYSFSKPIIDHLKTVLDNYEIDDSIIEQMLINESCRGKTFISPETYIISERKDVNSLKMIPVSAEFIPLRHVFKKFFELSSVFDETIEYVNSVKQQDRLTTNFVQGTLWKIFSKKDEEKKVLPLFLYFGKYKDNDPLVSHQNASKCSAVYVLIPCLPVMYQLKLKNIFLFILFNTLDRENIKNPIIISKIKEELEFLEKTGIVINLPGRQETLYFRLSLVLGDDLGSNYILGFTESLTTSKFCRFCLLDSSEMSRIFDEKDCQLRTIVNYKNDLTKNNPQETGVVERCIFEGIGGFHPVINITADIVLDVLEGICRHDLGLILHYFIEKEYFSLYVLNIFIDICNYGPKEPKPAEITEDHIRNEQIVMSASEIVVLIRYLPVIIGHLVPSDDEVWQLVLNMRTFINIMTGATLYCAPFDVHMTDYLLALPELFPNSLLPQHHFLIHYPRVLYHCGPLWKINTMLFEAEPIERQVSLNTDVNPVSVCRSIAMRHQLCQNYRFVMEITPKDLYYDAKEIKKISLSHFKDHPRALKLLVPFAQKPKNEITVLRSVEFKGYVIEFESVIEIIEEFADVPEEDDPGFFLVEKIILDNKNDIHVLTKKIDDVELSEHYESWEVMSDNYKWEILSLKEVSCSNITHIVNGVNGDKWIFR